MKHPDASARVRDALDAADPTVREAAVTALDRLGARGMTRQAARPWPPAIPTPAVRRAAGAALARQPDKEDDGGARA